MLKTSYFIVIIIAVATGQLSLVTNEPLETEILQDNPLKTSAYEEYGLCTKEYSCVDCYKARLCVSTTTGYRTQLVFNCNETSPTTPYCTDDSGTCTTTPPVSCAPAANFTCVRDGTYPDPTDCTRYFICVNGIPYSYKCDRAGLNYDSSREMCASGATCYTFNCRGKHGVKLAYGKTANIYAYCVNGSAYVVDRCPGNYELNADSQKCEPTCYSEGCIPDVAACTKYYKCVKTSPYASTYTITSEECPQTYRFDPLTLRCVPNAGLQGCVTNSG